MAYRLAEAGADLELVDIDERGLTTVAEELSKFKVKVGVYKVNLSSKEEIAALWEKLRGEEPDILVNNAGWNISFQGVPGSGRRFLQQGDGH